MKKVQSISINNSREPFEESKENLSSSYSLSLSKTRKIRRKVNKKKITKIVHTSCICYLNSEGKKAYAFYQQIDESTQKNQEELKNLAIRQAQQRNSKIISDASWYRI